MGLTFLAPAFFLGMAALAIPVVIHLLQREEREAVPFPSLMFLHRIPHRSVRRHRIRYWLLFLLRCAAVLLLVLAFARPFLEGAAPAVAEEQGARELVVLLDQSYSMAHGDRWERATGAARRAVQGLAPGDRASLVVFAQGAEAVGQPTADGAALLAAIDRARPGQQGTRYGPALRLAQRILDGSALARREVVLITDFQRVGWSEPDDVVLPEGTVLTPVDVSGDDRSNLAVASVALRRETREGRDRVQVGARVVNQGPTAMNDVPVLLELNGQQMQQQTVDFEAGAAVTVAFAPIIMPAVVSRAAVRAGTDDLPLDNVHHFTLRPGQPVSVLVLEHPRAREDQSLFLRHALSIGDRPAFAVSVKPVSSLRPADLDGQDVVVLNDAVPAAAVAGRLAAFVGGGGGLLIVAGERSVGDAWPAAAQPLIPGPMGPPVDRSPDRGATLAYLDYDHPVFEVFTSPRSGDFSAARFYRYRPVGDERQPGVLARYDDGSIALVEARRDAGKVLLWTSTLDRFWNDLALQPVFLPFIHRVVRYLAGYVEARSSFTVGQVLDLEQLSDVLGAEAVTAALDRGADLIVESPSGDRTRLARDQGPELLRLTEQGIYEIREPGASGARLALVAVNLDPTESDLASLDPEEFGGSVMATSAAPSGVRAGNLSDGTVTAEQQEQRQRLWWYLLAGAFLVLVTETAISNRRSRVIR